MNPQNSPTTPRPPGESGLGASVTEMGAALTDTKNTLAQSARDTAAKVKSAVTDTATRAKDEAGRLAAQKKEEAAQRIGSYSSAIHDSAKSLEEKDPNIAWFTHQAAEKLDGVADYLRNRDLNALRQDAEQMARRHPTLFFGGLFLAGLVLGNVVKASRRKTDMQDGTTGENGSGLGMENESGSGAMAYSGSAALTEPGYTDTQRTAGGI